DRATRGRLAEEARGDHEHRAQPGDTLPPAHVALETVHALGQGAQAGIIHGLPSLEKRSGESGLPGHWNTRSARTSSEGEIVSPRVAAVFRFTVRSNFRGCSMGSPPARAPLSRRSTKVAARRSRSVVSAQ